MAVIGGGAAGLMAAGMAASAGAKVLLFEKMPRPGCKLAITGKGRCNLTNIEPRASFETHFGSEAAVWLRPAFDSFFSDALMSFFEARGVPLVIERGGRVFPSCGRAPDVVKALLEWVRLQGAEMRLRSQVTGLCVRQGAVCGVETQDGPVGARSVVLAAGGASYPATGSTGDGYTLAAAVGLDLVRPRPALVPLETHPRPVRELDGLGLKNVRVTLVVDGADCDTSFGEMSFTRHGVSGPLVLTLSGYAVDALAQSQSVQLRVDLKPALSPDKLKARLLRDLNLRKAEPLRSVLRGLLPKPLVPVCLDATGLNGMMTAGRFSVPQQTCLLTWLKAMTLTISGHRGFAEAIVTAGGVSLGNVDPSTMQARSVSGLFLAGEVLDIAGDTGGYNLQAAFSTGVLAGRSAAVFSRCA